MKTMYCEKCENEIPSFMADTKFRSNNENMKEEIIKIVGFGMEPERAEIMADEIMKLFEQYYVAELSDDDHICNCENSTMNLDAGCMVCDECNNKIR